MMDDRAIIDPADLPSAAVELVVVEPAAERRGLRTQPPLESVGDHEVHDVAEPVRYIAAVAGARRVTGDQHLVESRGNRSDVDARLHGSIRRIDDQPGHAAVREQPTDVGVGHRVAVRGVRDAGIGEDGLPGHRDTDVWFDAVLGRGLASAQCGAGHGDHGIGGALPGTPVFAVGVMPAEGVDRGRDDVAVDRGPLAVQRGHAVRGLPATGLAAGVPSVLGVRCRSMVCGEQLAAGPAELLGVLDPSQPPAAEPRPPHGPDRLGCAQGSR